VTVFCGVEGAAIKLNLTGGNDNFSDVTVFCGVEGAAIKNKLSMKQKN